MQYNEKVLKEIILFLIEELEEEHYGIREQIFENIKEHWGLTKKDLMENLNNANK